MGIRQTVATALAAPLIRALEGVLSKSVDDVLTARAPAGRADVDAARGQLDDIRRDLSARRADLSALHQALALTQQGLDEDLETLMEGTPRPDADAVERSVRMLQAAVDEVGARIEALSARAGHAAARAEQASQIATTARATAESLADALDAR
jgi:methyl-accepting chemotaxis protein